MGHTSRPNRLGKSRPSCEDYILDSLLVPRLEQYLQNNNIRDVDSAVGYLRRNYREYMRKSQAPFRKQVQKAIRIVKARARDQESVEFGLEPASSNPDAEERLQRQERQHLARRTRSSEVSISDAESDESHGSGDQGTNVSFDAADLEGNPHGVSGSPQKGRDSGVRERRGQAKAIQAKQEGSDSEESDGLQPSYNLLNSSLRVTYGRPSLILEPPEVVGASDSSAPAGDQVETHNTKMASEGTRGSVDRFTSSSAKTECIVKTSDVSSLGTLNTPRPKNKRQHSGMDHLDTQLPKKVKRRDQQQAGRKLQQVVVNREIVEKSSTSVPKNISFKDLGGIEGVLHTIRQLIERPLKHPELYEFLGVQPPRGVLLHGPPGCGKTALANAIATETKVPFLRISAPEVVSGMSGESEAKVRSLFADAVKVAPSIIFIDEIDAIAQKRETAQKGMESRIVAQLLTCMDDLNQPLSSDSDDGDPSSECKGHLGHVVVIGATNRPDAIDPALRRAGRFDREIALGIPDESARARIIAALCRKLRLEGSADFHRIAKRTPGFVGADLAALTQEAAAIALDRIFATMEYAGTDERVTKEETVNDVDYSLEPGHREVMLEENKSLLLHSEHFTYEEMKDFSITMQDFEGALSRVQPSAKREGFTTLPDVTWDDVGSLGSVREELEFSVSLPIRHPEDYKELGLDMAMGVLLYGPPGCGKTLVAKAIANDAGANFICIKGPELLNKYVGESERAVRLLFVRARASAPCVLFFDEMDAIAPRRGSGENQAAERVVNQLLTEMDGLEQRKSVFIIAATNRPDMIDPALLRPGRLDKLLFVPLPDSEGRVSILNTLTRALPLAADVKIHHIAEQCDGFSGADLAAVVREASTAVVRERRKQKFESIGVKSPPLICPRHFEEALTRVSPSVSSKDRLRYERLRTDLRRTRGHLSKSNTEVVLPRLPSLDDMVGRIPSNSIGHS